MAIDAAAAALWHDCVRGDCAAVATAPRDVAAGLLVVPDVDVDVDADDDDDDDNNAVVVVLYSLQLLLR